MGRLKLRSQKKPSVWDRRKRYQAFSERHVIDNKDRVRTEGDPPGLPDGCTWVGVFGIDGDPTCRRTGDLFELEVKQRGHPYVIWEQDKTDWGPGDIPVVVLYATSSEAVATLADNFGKRDEKGRALFPFQCVRNTVTGDCMAMAGPAQAADVAQILDYAKDQRDRTRATEGVADLAEAAKPAND